MVHRCVTIVTVLTGSVILMVHRCVSITTHQIFVSVPVRLPVNLRLENSVNSRIYMPATETDYPLAYLLKLLLKEIFYLKFVVKSIHFIRFFKYKIGKHKRTALWLLFSLKPF